eukprot:m.309689 g.309689  ORF g.309689 m.309689 type:complete len:284 (+) comp19644_c0_seq4:79-930(+)
MAGILCCCFVVLAVVLFGVHAEHNHGDGDELTLNHDFARSTTPLLFPEEVHEWAHLVGDDRSNAVRNLFLSADNGLDAVGEPVGGAGDGQLTVGEIARRLSQVDAERMHLDAQAHLAELDKNTDGLLELSEVAGKDAMLAKRFAAADFNRDTYLSGDEVVAFFHPLAEVRMAPAAAAEMFLHLDTSRDGRLQRREIPVVPSTESSWLDRIGDAEVDGDGDVSGKELAHWLKSHAANRAVAHATDLLNEADTDKDGVIEVDELVVSQIAFVGQGFAESDAHDEL